MIAPIDIECQTKATIISCEYCVAGRECKLRYRIEKEVPADTMSWIVENPDQPMVC